MLRVYPLVLVFLLAAPFIDCYTVLAQTKVPAGEAEREIRKHLNTITDRLDKMDNLYKGEAAKGTLTREIEALGLKAEFNKVGYYHYIRWDWDRVREFYSIHIAALNESIANVLLDEYARREALDNLKRGMANWQEKETNVQRVYAGYVSGWAAEPGGRADRWDPMRERFNIFTLISREFAAIGGEYGH